MSLLSIFGRRLFAGLLWLCRFIWRLFTCRCLQRQKRIGELPFVMPKQQSQDISTPTFATNQGSQASWDNWANDYGVSDQIEEYRRRKQEEAARTKANQRRPQYGQISIEEKSNGDELDLFAGLQPKVKAPKKLLLKQRTEPRPDLFAVHGDQDTSSDGMAAYVPEAQMRELGELDFASASNNDIGWEEEECGDLDRIARDQRRRDRQMAHSKQVEQKRRANI